MATGTVTRTIGTRFTLSGIQNAVASLRSLATGFRANLQAMRASAARYFAPIIAGLKQIGAFSFKKLQQAATLAFKGIAAGAVLASLKIKAIAAAALESTRGITELTNQISKDSRRLGISAEDLSALRYGFEKQGVEPDEVLQSLSDIGNEFKAIRQQIDAADTAYAKTKSWNFAQVLAAGRTPGAIANAMSGNQEAAGGSFAGIADQQAFIRKQIIAAAPGDDAGRVRLVQQFKELETARLQLIQGLGQQGQALFSLQDYGLDFDQAIKGGVEGLTALSEAFRQVQDPALKLRISMQLFGEDAGAKMVTVLESGRQGIEEYRREIDRLGGTVTAADAKRGSDYKDSVLQTKLALQGVRLELDRGITPLLIESQKQLTEWLATNRKWIADTMKAAFVETRNLFLDIIDLFHGQSSGFRNGWLNTIAPTLLYAAELAGKLRDQLGKIFSGKDSDWEWLNLLRDSVVTTVKFIADAFRVAFGGKAKSFPFLDTAMVQLKWIWSAITAIPEQVRKVWNGDDSDWEWLNTVRDGLKFVRDLAVDVWAVLSGGEAQRFGFLNDWSKAVSDFAAKVKDALKVVTDAFGVVHSAFQKIVGVFGGDATTIALVGIFARIALAITGIGTAATIASGLVGRLLGIGGAATAVGAAGTAATAGGLAGALIGVRTLVVSLISKFGVLGLVATGVLAGGKALLDYSEASSDKVLEAQVKLVRIQAETQLKARETYQTRFGAKPAFQGSFGGVALSSREQLAELARQRGTSFADEARSRAGIIGQYAANDQRIRESVNLNITLGGKTVQATVDKTNAEILKDINRNLRAY